MTSPTIDAPDGLPLTVPALLAARAAERPDDVLLVCDDDRLTYGEADRRSARLARALLGAGAGHGTRVALLHPNGSDFVAGWLAAARIGAVSVPLSTFSTSAELAGLLRGADVTFLLAAPSYRSHDYVAALQAAIPEFDPAASSPLWSPVVPSLRRIAFGDPGWARAGADVLAAAEAAVSPGDRMVIVHTSGSTSEPKGVIHTHGALIRHLDNLNQMRRYGPGEV
ncbi:MAG TPA: AMP-binding protein, partial [Acidimicrobiales bacterium]